MKYSKHASIISNYTAEYIGIVFKKVREKKKEIYHDRKRNKNM